MLIDIAISQHCSGCGASLTSKRHDRNSGLVVARYACGAVTESHPDSINPIVVNHGCVAGINGSAGF